MLLLFDNLQIKCNSLFIDHREDLIMPFDVMAYVFVHYIIEDSWKYVNLHYITPGFFMNACALVCHYLEGFIVEGPIFVLASFLIMHRALF